MPTGRFFRGEKMFAQIPIDVVIVSVLGVAAVMFLVWVNKR
jgi:hypothetical protein